jgi:hypothetical protein
MKKDDIGKEIFICSACGIVIKQSTAMKNDGLCTPCKKKKEASAGRAGADAAEAK